MLLETIAVDSSIEQCERCRHSYWNYMVGGSHPPGRERLYSNTGRDRGLNPAYTYPEHSGAVSVGTGQTAFAAYEAS